jgi:hypothetical protein
MKNFSVRRVKMPDTMTWKQVFNCFLFFLALSFPLNGHTAEKRIALLVDNSGSMYGKCHGMVCNDVMDGVKLSLKNVLTLLYAYNREQKKEQQVDVVLFLFGGYHQKKEEFREIVLTKDLEKDVALLESELIPGTSYKDTDFSIALNRALENLKTRGKASCTVFLTDAISGRQVDEMDFSMFGRTFFYSLNRKTVELDAIAAEYERRGLQAEVNYLEHGWEITSSFVKAFLMLFQPREGNHYFFHRNSEIGSQQDTLELKKLSEASATFHLIFHDRSAPGFKELTLNGRKMDSAAYTTFQGPNIVTVKLKKSSPPGEYTVEFTEQPAACMVSVFGIEEAPLLLLEKKHGVSEVSYRKNEEVVFDFSFGFIDKGRTVYLTEEENQAFSRFVHAGFTISENKGSDFFEHIGDLTHFTVSHAFKPENRGDSQYTIKTGWSYLNANPVPETEVGAFLLLKEPAQVLKLDFSSDTKDNKIWQGRPVSAKARWENLSLPERYSEITGIDIADTATGNRYHLKAAKGGQSFHGDLGKDLSPGRYIFELVDPLHNGEIEVSLTGKELEIRPRTFQLDIRETTERSGKTREGILNKLKNGFLYLTGNKKKDRWFEEYQIKRFPITKDIKIPYYDSHIHELKVKPVLSPIFDDEILKVICEYKGPKAYSAADAREPIFFGLYRGDHQEIDNALTIQLDPDKRRLTRGELHTVKFIKKECDWEIDSSQMAPPSMTYIPSIEVSGAEIQLAENKMGFSFSTQAWDREIISALRASAFIIFAALSVLLFLIILGFLIYLRSHSLHRQEHWEVICRMMPEDFCRPGFFPLKAYKYCEERSIEGGRTPGEVLSQAVRGNDRKFLSRIYKTFSLKELRDLREKCQSCNFDSTWEFPVSGGTNVTVYGSEMNSSEDGVRLRDFECSLPPVIGNISARQSGNGVQMKFTPSPDIVFRSKDVLFIPPHNGAVELQSGDVILVGRHKEALPVALNISAYADTLVIQCKKR